MQQHAALYTILVQAVCIIYTSSPRLHSLYAVRVRAGWGVMQLRCEYPGFAATAFMQFCSANDISAYREPSQCCLQGVTITRAP
jgi:hypothetical protein